MTTLFVYGTLKRGYRNHQLLEKSSYMGKGTISGYDLYDLGSFPAIIRGTGEVYGELYEIDTETMKKVDWLESEGSLYIKMPVNVSQDGKMIIAITYIFNRQVHNAKKIDREWRNGYDQHS